MAELDDAWALLDEAPLNIVFIAGPYFGDGREETIEANIREAEKYAVALANRGIGFFCPHLHTQHFGIKAQAGEPFYHRLDFQHLVRSDAALFTPRWSSSSGAKREEAWAKWRQMPTFFPTSPGDLEAIVEWNRSHKNISILELEGLLFENAVRFEDFSPLPGWSHRDQRVIDVSRQAVKGRKFPYFDPETGKFERSVSAT